MKIIFPILFILLSVVAFMFGVNPFYKEVSAIKSDIEVYNTALDNSTALQKTEDALIKSFNEIKDEDKDRLNKLLPTSVNNIQLILEIERIANQHNMPIKDLKFDPLRKKTTTTGGVVSAIASNDTRPYGVFPIEFTTEGDYNSFVSFLKDLETNLRLVDIRNVTFTVPTVGAKNQEGINPNIYKYTLKVETYWLK